MPENAFSTRKKVVLWGFLLVIFLLIVSLTTVSYLSPSGQGLVGFFTRFHFEAMLGIALGGVVLGAGSFYLFSHELAQTHSTLQNNVQLLVSLLAPDEKACVEYLIHHNREAFQHDLARLPEMNRLKAHRVVRRLAERGIVEVQNHGKANRVRLAQSIQPEISQ